MDAPDSATDFEPAYKDSKARMREETALLKHHGIPVGGPLSLAKQRLEHLSTARIGRLHRDTITQQLRWSFSAIARDLAIAQSISVEEARNILTIAAGHLKSANVVAWASEAIEELTRFANQLIPAAENPISMSVRVDEPEFWSLFTTPTESWRRRLNITDFHNLIGYVLFTMKEQRLEHIVIMSFYLLLDTKTANDYRRIPGAVPHMQVRYALLSEEMSLNYDGKEIDTILLGQAFMKTVIVRPESHNRSGDRVAGKRASASQYDVYTVTLRKRVHLPKPHEAMAQAESMQECQQRHYSEHWKVKGHWRNQYYPSTKQYKRIWIAEYEKGDRSQPLRATSSQAAERVTVVRR